MQENLECDRGRMRSPVRYLLPRHISHRRNVSSNEIPSLGYAGDESLRRIHRRPLVLENTSSRINSYSKPNYAKIFKKQDLQLYKSYKKWSERYLDFPLQNPQQISNWYKRNTNQTAYFQTLRPVPNEMKKCSMISSDKVKKYSRPLGIKIYRWLIELPTLWFLVFRINTAVELKWRKSTNMQELLLCKSARRRNV